MVEEATKTTIKCYVSKQKGFIKHIQNSEINDGTTCSKKTYKVITARAAHKAKSGFGNIFIGYPNEIHTDTYISFRVNTEDEAKSLHSYLQTKLPNFLLSIRKKSQDISNSTIQWIPLPPLDREWNDAKIYKYYKLTPEEIGLINSTNIVGYKTL